MTKFACDIVTPEAKFYSDEVHFVVVPGSEGEMGFLYDHVPLVSTLADGVVRVQKDEGLSLIHIYRRPSGFCRRPLD